jgi:phosphonate transport system ATP-binding protein
MNVAIDNLQLVLPGEHRALAGVTLAIGRGERVAVIGPSGAGKTSLLRVLGTALRPTAGALAIDGADPWLLPRARLRRLRSGIGMVHQSPPLPPRQRLVTAVLAGRLGAWGFWRGLASLAYPADIAGARASLARLDLDGRLFDRCDRLSGGQLQRVGVARVLYQQPALILADEPVSSLDPQLADHTVGELHREAQARGVTRGASLHAVDLALKWFPRIVGLRDGAVAFDAPPVRVSDRMLRDLYGAESPIVPTQDNQPLERPEPKPRAAQPLCR